MWRIRITQHTCDAPESAPEGCLQYLTGISGNISSFNWKLTDNMNGASFSNHLSNLRYSVCVRRESGYCSIEWSVGTSFEVMVCEHGTWVNFFDLELNRIFLPVWASPLKFWNHHSCDSDQQ